MRVAMRAANPKFQPRTIEITCETEDEYRAMFSLFNHAALRPWMHQHGLNPDAIIDVMGKPAGYHDAFGSLSKAIREAK